MARFSIPGIANAISTKHGLSKHDAENFVTVLFELINEGLYHDKIVKVKGLGTFKIIDVRERESVNVNTGERVIIEGHGKITFTPDPVMRDLVNKPFAQFETVVLNDGVDIDELNCIQVSESSNEEQNTDNEFEDDDITVTKDNDISEPIFNQDENSIVEENKELEDNVLISENNIIKTKENLMNNVSGETESDIVENTIEENGMPKSEQTQEMVVEISKNESSVSSETVECDELDNNSKVPFVLRYKWIFLIFIFLIITGLAFFAGFYCNKYLTEPQIKYVKVYVYKKHIAEQTSSEILLNKDTVNNKVEVSSENKDTTKTSNRINLDLVDNHANDKNVSADNVSVLKRARVMVDKGAYRIIGTEKTITVKKGENLKQISKFYFGDGMECYIQVHNGVTEVKEGQRLKIPKLLNKKKR